MRDGCHNSIHLTHSSIHKNVTYYHFEIALGSRIYEVNYRYSKLRVLAELLPNVLIDPI
mgnify:CR=1 FL=1